MIALQLHAKPLKLLVYLIELVLSIDARPAAMGVFYEVYGTNPTMYSEHLLSVGWAFIRICLAGLRALCVLVL